MMMMMAMRDVEQVLCCSSTFGFGNALGWWWVVEGFLLKTNTTTVENGLMMIMGRDGSRDGW